jgi:hypothetical protein
MLSEVQFFVIRGAPTRLQPAPALGLRGVVSLRLFAHALANLCRRRRMSGLGAQSAAQLVLPKR